MNRTRIAELLRPRWSGWVSAALLAVVVGVTNSAALATTLEIQFLGLDLYYDGNSIFDAGSSNTSRTGNPIYADPLTSVQFFLDGTLVHTLSSDVFADIYITDLGAMPAAGGLLASSGNGNSFGIDLLTSNNDPGWGLALNIDSMQMFYSGSNIAISVSGLATSIPVQLLPNGYEFDANQPLTIVMSSANLTGITTGVVDEVNVVTSMHAAGTGNIAGILVPEPGSMALLSIGFIGAVLLGWRHRKQR